jgi:hypothetical protein
MFGLQDFVWMRVVGLYKGMAFEQNGEPGDPEEDDCDEGGKVLGHGPRPSQHFQAAVKYLIHVSFFPRRLETGALPMNT